MATGRASTNGSPAVRAHQQAVCGKGGTKTRLWGVPDQVSNRKASREYDRELYKQRNLIERTFNKLKHWHRIATRYDRKSLYFLSAIYLVSAVTWSL
jgi:transposase